MISGIGLDLVELARIQTVYERNPRFAERILSVREQEKFQKLSEGRKLEYLAGRFAAKEAFAKALGTGIGTKCTFQQIEVLNNDIGKPILYFQQKLVNGFVSITHTQSVAAAQVILQEGESK